MERGSWWCGAPGNRDLYPDYGKEEGLLSNEEHSRPTLNIVGISRTRDDKGRKGRKGKGQRKRGRERERVGGEKERYHASLVGRCISSVDTRNRDENIDNANNATLHVARREDRA